MLLADNQLAQRLDVGAPKLAVRIEVGKLKDLGDARSIDTNHARTPTQRETCIAWTMDRGTPKAWR